MSHAQAVLVLESNLAFESQHLLHALNLANVPNWVALSEGQGGTLGWLTAVRPPCPGAPSSCRALTTRAGGAQNERKEAMVFQLRDALKVGSIQLSTHFFSLKLGVNDAIKMVRSELTNFAIVVEPPKTTFASCKVRKTYTGKIQGEQDDIAIAIQLAITGLDCFYQNPVRPLPRRAVSV